MIYIPSNPEEFVQFAIVNSDLPANMFSMALISGAGYDERCKWIDDNIHWLREYTIPHSITDIFGVKEVQLKVNGTLMHIRVEHDCECRDQLLRELESTQNE